MFSKYISLIQRSNYQWKSFIPLILKLNPYLTHQQLITEAKKCSLLMKSVPEKYRDKILKSALNEYLNQNEIGSIGTIFLSSLIGATIGNTFGYLIRERFSKYAKEVGLV